MRCSLTDAVAAHAPAHAVDGRSPSASDADRAGSSSRRPAERGRRAGARSPTPSSRAWATCSSGSPTRSRPDRHRGQGEQLVIRLGFRRAVSDSGQRFDTKGVDMPAEFSLTQEADSTTERHVVAVTGEIDLFTAPELKAPSARRSRPAATHRRGPYEHDVPRLDRAGRPHRRGQAPALSRGAPDDRQQRREHRQDVRDHRTGPDLHDPRHARRRGRGARRRRRRPDDAPTSVDQLQDRFLAGPWIAVRRRRHRRSSTAPRGSSRRRGSGRTRAGRCRTPAPPPACCRGRRRPP